MGRPERLLIFLLLCFPLAGKAESRCLWLNTATAGRLLGGTAEATVRTLPGGGASPVQTANARSSAGPMSANPTGAPYAEAGVDDAYCVFEAHSPAAGQLRIQVHTMKEPAKAFLVYARRCGARGTPLKAIGNEAVLCDAAGGRLAEHIAGRVRDRFFVIDLETGDRSITRIALREKAKAAAEIVAGNLF